VVDALQKARIEARTGINSRGPFLLIPALSLLSERSNFSNVNAEAATAARAAVEDDNIALLNSLPGTSLGEWQKHSTMPQLDIIAEFRMNADQMTCQATAATLRRFGLSAQYHMESDIDCVVLKNPHSPIKRRTIEDASLVLQATALNLMPHTLQNNFWTLIKTRGGAEPTAFGLRIHDVEEADRMVHALNNNGALDARVGEDRKYIEIPFSPGTSSPTNPITFPMIDRVRSELMTSASSQRPAPKQALEEAFRLIA
jgi:hypothetical protein